VASSVCAGSWYQLAETVSGPERATAVLLTRTIPLASRSHPVGMRCRLAWSGVPTRSFYFKYPLSGGHQGHCIWHRPVIPRKPRSGDEESRDARARSLAPSGRSG
jgi:hypothetical protein